MSLASSVRHIGRHRLPQRKPRATGLKATKAAPMSRQASSTAISGLRVHSEYSVCTAAIGCTAWALRRWRPTLRTGQWPDLAPCAPGRPTRPRCLQSAPSCPSGAGSTGRSRRSAGASGWPRRRRGFKCGSGGRRSRASACRRRSSRPRRPCNPHLLASVNFGGAASAPRPTRVFVGAKAVERGGVKQRDTRIQRRQQHPLALLGRRQVARRRRGSGSCSPGQWPRQRKGRVGRCAVCMVNAIRQALSCCSSSCSTW